MSTLPFSVTSLKYNCEISYILIQYYSSFIPFKTALLLLPSAGYVKTFTMPCWTSQWNKYWNMADFSWLEFRHVYCIISLDFETHYIFRKCSTFSEVPSCRDYNYKFGITAFLDCVIGIYKHEFATRNKKFDTARRSRIQCKQDWSSRISHGV